MGCPCSCAAGCRYLNDAHHEIHGNLKLENVLVGHAGICELQLTDYDMMARLGHRMGVKIDPYVTDA